MVFSLLSTAILLVPVCPIRCSY